MKTLTGTMALLASASVAGAFSLIPNGDFSTAAGDSYNFAFSGGSAVVFETTGGNGGGYGRIDSTGGTWGGVIVGEGGTGAAPAGGDGILLSTLGLTAGGTYTFQWDQIDILGNGAIAGIKIESWDAGGTGYLNDGGDQLFATNTSWTTETYSYTIDPGANAIKVVMVQNQGFNGIGGGNTGFDNIGVIPEPTSTMLLGLGALGMLVRRRR